jgi:ankyrin repeat protein
MATPQRSRRSLPANPSEEFLRKMAKRLAKSEDVRLASAQRRLAAEYGYRDWAALMRVVVDAARLAGNPRSLLSEAAMRAEEASVRERLSRGDPVEGSSGEVNSPLWWVCDSEAPAEQRIAVAGLLLEAGASPRRACEAGATALHAAARRGPLPLVELLIRHGALSWQTDRRSRRALDYARQGSAGDREMIVELLDRPVIRDKQFRAAVGLIHAGNLDALGRLLDQRPGLLSERAIEPDCYPRDYFRDPKLFWFIANNPTMMRPMAPNIVAIGEAMVARGVERSDLDYTLELVMSNGQSTKEGRQTPLISMLIEAGATATPQAIVMALAHRCLKPIETLLARGVAMTVPIAAALDRRRDLAALLRHASPQDRQSGFGLAVINMRLAAARLCLDAGADPNQFLPVHRHSTPLHQAAINDDIPMLKLLVERGAHLDTLDTLWRSTPLGWAMHTKKSGAEKYLRSLQQDSG